MGRKGKKRSTKGGRGKVTNKTKRQLVLELENANSDSDSSSSSDDQSAFYAKKRRQQREMSGQTARAADDDSSSSDGDDGGAAPARETDQKQATDFNKKNAEMLQNVKTVEDDGQVRAKLNTVHN